MADLACRFETCFGGEARTENLLSTSRALDLDMDSVFPTDACTALNRWGMPDYYVPVLLGGSWCGSDELMLLLRLIARRDLTLAIAHAKTFVGCVSVWIGGSDEQARRLGNEVREGSVVSFGLTERSHGSDICSTGTTALRIDGGYVLNGEKYLINNATRCHFMTVFARTAFTRNARDFSVFLVEKRALATAEFSVMSKQSTHGIRGADISGILFANAHVKRTALIGMEGGGLECVLKGLQITRTLCGGLSAGAADSALRIVLRFAATRQIAERTLNALPLIRAILAEACADMLIIDVIAQTGARAINVMPERMSFISSIVKAEVPERAERMVEMLGEVLGARAYLEGSARSDGYAKIQRDIRLVAIFDGNTIVNLQALRLQMRELARRRPTGAAFPGAGLMKSLFDFSTPLPEFRREALSLACYDGDPVVAGLDESAELLLQDDGLAAEVRVRLQLRLSVLLTERQVLEAEALGAPFNIRLLMPRDFELARRYGRVFASACCVRVFLHNRSHLARELVDGAWLADVLDRLAGVPIPDGTALLVALEAQRRARQMFGVVPIKLAEASQPEAGVQ